MAFEVCVVEVVIVQPDSSNGEEFKAASLGWVGVSEGLRVVENEIVEAISLDEHAGVGNGSIEFVVKHGLDQRGRLRCEHN